VAGSSRPAPLRPALLLAVAGGVLVLAGVAGLVGGLFLSAWLYSLLPPTNVDQHAVGGAVFALGVSIGLGGVLHLLLAVPLFHGRQAALVPAAVLCVSMAVATLVLAIAATVSAAAGQGVPAALVPLALVLLAVSIAYALAATALVRGRQPG